MPHGNPFLLQLHYAAHCPDGGQGSGRPTGSDKAAGDCAEGKTLKTG